MSKNIEETFTEIYKNKFWDSKESVSGRGSEIEQTKRIIIELPKLYDKFEIKSVLDIPCGDYHWMKYVDDDSVDYIGADIVEDLILQNEKKFPDVYFKHLDLASSPLPKVDLVIARDIFVHMTYDMIEKCIANLIKSGSRYLLTTTFTSEPVNYDLEENGKWRPLNLLLPPFSYIPQYLINEDCTECDINQYVYTDKCLILFDLNKLRI